MKISLKRVLCSNVFPSPYTSHVANSPEKKSENTLSFQLPFPGKNVKLASSGSPAPPVQWRVRRKPGSLPICICSLTLICDETSVAGSAGRCVLVKYYGLRMPQEWNAVHFLTGVCASRYQTYTLAGDLCNISSFGTLHPVTLSCVKEQSCVKEYVFEDVEDLESGAVNWTDGQIKTKKRFYQLRYTKKKTYPWSYPVKFAEIFDSKPK
ncbi:hypothetical protein EVAR_34353_1 [Eumeta japonica]|uniref:Uncharacterized protein n=1 Tax=Eumeta variegata TaxID=151549 RepID=A0A4C1VCU7_EUMVA|nr:hypothetical protein EVAR_34353_1 [Eumeta japonica]